MSIEHVDVLIVGAGLSGVGAACHLQREHPGRSVAVLEARGAIGGTWDLFRYPGVRSDSDMFTLGYSFRPWTGEKALADGASIREYVVDTAREFGVDTRIRYHHRVIAADWSSESGRWTVHATRTDPDGGAVEQVTLTCGFLFVCSGYYRYDQGYSPDIPGLDDFAGQVVHPQHWPTDLDYDGKRVVVIGSGATAVTLVPSMAERAAHVTMLQRSPSYVLSLPSVDPLAARLRRLPARISYPLIRWKNVLLSQASFQFSRRAPRLMRRALSKGAAAQLPPGYDVGTHFGPDYDPWDQRLCLVPGGDLFRSVRNGDASVVTDRIERVTEAGIRLASGRDLDADIIVTATGLNLLAIGGMTLSVDGREIALGDQVAYKGMMLSGVPNFALTLGYTNASWTLKSDLVARYVCRLLTHLDRTGLTSATPVRPDTDDLGPLIDLKSGYVRRSMDALPKQGPRAPWRLHQNYPRDLLLMRYGTVTDGMRFAAAADRAAVG